MNYHNILHDNMLNGDGLRVVLFISGCSFRCKNCQNPQTWNVNSGIPFDELAKEELFEELGKDYISGITFSGGDPLHENNVNEVLNLIIEIKDKFPSKNIWLYTGYEWEDIWSDSKIIIDDYTNKAYKDYQKRQQIVSYCDVVVDGRFVEELSDVNYHWAGSVNQRVILSKESLKENKIILYN